MYGFGALVAPSKTDKQELAPKDSSPDLIAEPFIDGLARVQKEKDLIKYLGKITAKRLRDGKLVANYLKSKFPDAFSMEMKVPEKDFARILRLAKRKYVARVAAGVVGTPIGIFSFVSVLVKDPGAMIGVPLFFGGLTIAVLSIVLTFTSLLTLTQGE